MYRVDKGPQLFLLPIMQRIKNTKRSKFSASEVETDRYTDTSNKERNDHQYLGIMEGSPRREWWILLVNSFEMDVISAQSSFQFP